jgi:hypothetical protein
MTTNVTGATSSDSDVPATARSFDALEQQLLELRRSLGIDEGPRAVRAAPVSAPVPAPAPAPAPAHVPEPEAEAVFDAELDAEPVPAPPALAAEAPATVAPVRVRVAAPERPRRGLGADLVLLAGAWAGLIVLVVFVLDRAS